MYTKEEAAALKKEFWSKLRDELAGQRSADGKKVTWVNYKTGVRDIYFRMHADKKEAAISIDIAHADLGIQELFYEQFLEFKTYLHNILGEEWIWAPQIQNAYGQSISTIYKPLVGVNVFNKKDWNKIIKFLKPRIVALDEFWCDAMDNFEALM